jgi:hypothetical protein
MWSCKLGNIRNSCSSHIYRRYNTKVCHLMENIPIDRKTLSLVSNDPGDCCCASSLDATTFEDGYPTTEELMCSAVSGQRVYNSYATCISQTISHESTQPSIHMYKKFEQKGWTRDSLHKVLDIGTSWIITLTCYVTCEAHIESLWCVYKTLSVKF